jgi:hypothetical protein
MFALRYLPEYSRGHGNYSVPSSLLSMPIEGIDLLDKRYTFDQIAERMAFEIVINYGERI